MLSWALSGLVSSHASVYLCIASTSSPNHPVIDGLDVKYYPLLPKIQTELLFRDQFTETVVALDDLGGYHVDMTLATRLFVLAGLFEDTGSLRF